MKNVTAIIAARGGSKGIPNKNIVEFCNKPLIYWSINIALNTPEISNVWVTTDDKKIANISENFGANTIIRPKELCNDIIMPDAAWEHAVKEVMAKGIVVDTVIALQNTSPIREKTDLSNALKKYYNSDFDTMFSASCATDYTIWSETKNRELKSLNFDWKNRKRRQDMNKQYLENGSFYIFTPSSISKSKNRFFGKIGTFEMEKWKSIEIDDNEDLKICEILMNNFLLNK